MSVKEKEFLRNIEKAKKSRNLEIKLRSLSDAYIRYLKGENGLYSENAIALIEKSIIAKQEEPIPVELHELYFEVGMYYAAKGDYETALSILAKIENSRNLSIMMQARYEIGRIKVKQNLEAGKIDTETIDKIKEIVKDDQEHELETAESGKFSEFDIFCSYFGDKIPVDDLTERIFPVDMKKPKKIEVKIDEGESKIKKTHAYVEELSANNRLKFLMENFKIKFARLGEGKFTGSILFEIEGSDLVIVENFWQRGKDGVPVEDYGKATYILPKDQMIDLISLSRGEIKGKNDPRIQTISHGGKNYYNNLITRFNEAQNSKLQSIDQKSDPLKNVKHERKNAKKEIAEKPDAKEMTNEEFLNMINQNLGGIIKPNIMEGLLKRASYSFEKVYEDKLKGEIFERLEILEIPDELKEIEAQKVFVYIRMIKNLSVINSGAINGKKLEEFLDDAVIEYSEAMKLFEEHCEDGLSYADMKDAMKKCVETGKDPFAKETITEKDDIIEDKEGVLDSLLGEETKKGGKSKAIDVAVRYAELLKRSEELDQEIERASRTLEEKQKQLEEDKQATQVAIEEERKAKNATEEARGKEAASLEEVDAILAAQEKIKAEKKELEDKISKIDDMLK